MTEQCKLLLELSFADKAIIDALMFGFTGVSFVLGITFEKVRSK